MTLSAIDVARPRIAAGATHWVVLAGAVSMAALGLFLQWSTHLNHDIAWIIYSAAEMLDGARFGRDIIEPNPPLAWLLAMPSAAAWKYLSIAPDQSYRLLVAAVAAAVLLHLYKVLPRVATRAEARTLVLALCFYLFIGAAQDFGQREYLCLVLTLPYLALAAARVDGVAASPRSAIAIGVAAGIGLSLKPYFLAVPLLVEAVGLLRTRQIRFPIRIETVSIVAVAAIYVACVLILAPAYVTDVVPLVRKIYWAFDENLAIVVGTAGIEVLGLAVALHLHLKGNGSSLEAVLLAAAGGFFVSYLVQHKGYTYQGMPVRVLVGSTLALQVMSLFYGATIRGKGVFLTSVLTLACAGLSLAGSTRLAAVWYRDMNLATGPGGRLVDEVAGVVDRYGGSGGYLALATHPFPGFPTALYAHSPWVSRTNGTWLVPAIAKLRARGDPADRGRLHEIEQTAWRMLREELAAHAPGLILVDARSDRHALHGMDFDILAFYLEDPQTRALLQPYVEQQPVGGFRVLARRAAMGQP
jgi:hypothetical protein